jgi:hypothetical protein
VLVSRAPPPVRHGPTTTWHHPAPPLLLPPSQAGSAPPLLPPSPTPPPLPLHSSQGRRRRCRESAPGKLRPWVSHGGCELRWPRAPRWSRDGAGAGSGGGHPPRRGPFCLLLLCLQPYIELSTPEHLQIRGAAAVTSPSSLCW